MIPFKKLNNPTTGIGESWELSGLENNESIVANGVYKGSMLSEMLRKHKGKLVGEANYARFGNRFPLLIKFIDAKQDLSIQVHPTDDLAKKRHNSNGKTEMWYVVEADKETKLRVGFSKQITPKEYIEHIRNNTITEVLQEYEIGKGDVFFLPAGRIHSIGAGAFIAEIQQTSDITYRIYDFNRKDANGNPRELHTDLAREAIDYEVSADYRTQYESIANKPVELVACSYFTTSMYDITEKISCDYSELDSFVIFICIEGACQLTDNKKNEITLHSGETVLFSATTQEVTITPNSAVKLLEVYL
jgi:mannose-6-phosphate isomerase